jgi:hypothetical protein
MTFAKVFFLPPPILPSFTTNHPTSLSIWGGGTENRKNKIRLKENNNKHFFRLLIIIFGFWFPILFFLVLFFLLVCTFIQTLVPINSITFKHSQNKYVPFLETHLTKTAHPLTNIIVQMC